MDFVENILDCYRRATDAERAEGLAWYSNAHDLALSLSPDDVWRGAGVIASFSPLKKWELNVRLAKNAFATGIATGHTSLFNSCAQRILDGEHTLDVLRGDKTRAFASAIATNGKSEIATIDRHAHDIAMGRVFSEKERVIGKRLFREMSEAYGKAAEIAGISVAQMQAATWVRWKNEKGNATA